MQHFAFNLMIAHQVNEAIYFEMQEQASIYPHLQNQCIWKHTSDQVWRILNAGVVTPVLTTLRDHPRGTSV